MSLKLVYKYGSRIVVPSYSKYKDRIDAFCCRHLCGYEIRRDGSVVIICD
jgi:hypothetical protein